MTLIKNKKLLFATILSAVVLATAMTLLVTNTTKEAVAQVKQPDGPIGVNLVTVSSPEEHIANGGKSAVKVEIPVKHVMLKRGTTTTVDITLRHLGGKDPYPLVNVGIISPYHDIYYPPALTASTTSEQRLNAIETGNQIPGSVDLSTLISYSETGPMKIGSNGKYVIKMYITIPNDIPVDMIGHGGHLEIPLKVTDSDGNSNTVVWQNGGIDFTVVS